MGSKRLTPRKANFFLLIVILAAALLTPVHTQHAATLMEVQPGFYFYGVDDGGPISFTSPITTAGWYFESGYVYFKQLRTTDVTWSEVGFNCSDNAEMKIIALYEKQLQYNVTAAAGQNSTTWIVFPTLTNVYKVDNITAWAYDDALRVLEVNVTHSSSEYVTVYFTSGWGDVFDLVDSAFTLFGVVDYVSQLTAYINGLVSYFSDSLTNIVLIVIQEFRFINLVFNSLLYWGTGFLSALIEFIEFWQDIMDGTSAWYSELGNLWDWIGWNTWSSVLPYFLLIWWFTSIDNRAKYTPGGEIQVVANDFNTAANIMSWFLGVFSFVANTIIDRVYGFIDWLG